jgi:hypothetical protein
MLPQNAMGFEVGTTRGSRMPGQSLMAWAENLGYFNSSMSPGSKARSGQNWLVGRLVGRLVGW